MGVVSIRKNDAGKITVTFPYSPDFIAKVKRIPGHRWHPDDKCWSFPHTDGIIENILKVFEGEEIRIDPTLKSAVPNEQSIAPVAAGETNASRSRPQFEAHVAKNLEDLRRELVSRKYNYKTIKDYLYYNKDLIRYAGKSPSEIRDEDIKDYLVYLSEEKGSATSTLNQAINALKFYYGTVLKKKFIYEVKRPRKDKKLPVVLSQEEVARILTSVENIKTQGNPDACIFSTRS